MSTCGFSKILTCFSKVEGEVKSTGLGAGLVSRNSNRDAYSKGTRKFSHYVIICYVIISLRYRIISKPIHRRLSIRKKQTYSENDIVHECLADEKRRPSSAHLALDDVIVRIT